MPFFEIDILNTLDRDLKLNGAPIVLAFVITSKFTSCCDRGSPPPIYGIRESAFLITRRTGSSSLNKIAGR